MSRLRLFCSRMRSGEIQAVPARSPVASDALAALIPTGPLTLFPVISAKLGPRTDRLLRRLGAGKE